MTSSRRVACGPLGLVYDPEQVVTAKSDREHRVARFRDDLARAPRLSQRIAIAHELGHLILDTAAHTATGVMAGHDAQLSDDDRALADRTR